MEAVSAFAAEPVVYRMSMSELATLRISKIKCGFDLFQTKPPETLEFQAVFVVELRGFEPLTSTLPVWHSSQLS